MRTSSGRAILAAGLILVAPGCNSPSTTPVRAGISTTRTSASTPTVPASSSRTGWLAYQDTSYRIRLVRPDGSEDHALDMTTSGPEDNPDWSPDGKRLTFIGSGNDPDPAANPSLWVINSDGTGLSRIVRCSDPCQLLDDPAWSPDGSTIMYSRLQPDARTGGRLETVTLNTRATRTILTAQPGSIFSGVRYAPDGKAVVLELVRTTPGNYDEASGVTLARVDLTTARPVLQPLADPALWPETPDWSPQGDLIVYAAHPQVGADDKDLFVIKPDGASPRRLTTLVDRGGEALHPDFTSDGTSVVFAGSLDGRSNFMSVDAIAAEPTPALAVGSLYGHHPRSQPVR